MISARELSLFQLRDIDTRFLQTIAVGLVWEYQQEFERLRNDSELSLEFRREEFGRRRHACATKALEVAARAHGVPYDFIRIASNGQRKIVVRAGRVLIIQEAISTLADDPRASQYKRELAEAHSAVRQLELDLGDRPSILADWSGSTLAVLLHGTYGADFETGEIDFGYLMLGIPDAAYSHWIVRLDLHDIAMYGLDWPLADAEGSADVQPSQPDKVIVTLKSKASKKQHGQ